MTTKAGVLAGSTAHTAALAASELLLLLLLAVLQQCQAAAMAVLQLRREAAGVGRLGVWRGQKAQEQQHWQRAVLQQQAAAMAVPQLRQAAAGARQGVWG